MRIAVILAALAAMPTALRAQPPCATFPTDIEEHALLKSLFTDVSYDWWRTSFPIPALPSSTSVSVMSQWDWNCAIAVSKLQQHLQSLPDWPAIQQDGYKYAIVTIGPYRVARVCWLDPTGQLLNGRCVLKIFGSTWNFVGESLF